MRFISLLLLTILSLPAIGKESEDSLIVRREYKATVATSAIKIDGMLDDPEWAKAEVTTGFRQNSPTENAPVSFETEVRILYDNLGLYIAAKMFDNKPDSINRQLGLRDDYVNADDIRFVFDTYNTQQDAFDFTVTASGVQQDSRFSDYNYNAVWRSAVNLQADGWSCEILIPWSALRFPTGNNNDWGMQITRNIKRKFEFDQWALTPKDKANPQKYWGLLKGLNDVDAPVRLSLTPYLTTIWQDDDRFGSSPSSTSFTGGLDLKFGINESFTVDMTLLPDFSQVQSDNVVKNLGAFEVPFQEFRPFFTEGVDLFQRGNLFYSRRIGKTPSGFYGAQYQADSTEELSKNPSRSRLLNATKVSGRTNLGLGLGVLNAFVDNTYATLEDTITGETRNVLTEPRSNYNIFVMDRQLANGSSVYFINTNVIRTGGYRSSNVTGTGFVLNNKDNTWMIRANGAVSDVLYPNSSGNSEFTAELGYKYDFMLAKTSGSWQYGIGREVLSKQWDCNDLGLTFENNFAANRAFLLYQLFNPKWIFNYASSELSVNYTYNLQTKGIQNFGFNLFSYLQFKNFWSVYIGSEYAPLESYDYFEPRVDGRAFLRAPIVTAFMGINSNSNKKVSFGADFYLGTTGYISPTIPKNPWIGGGPRINIRATDRFSTSLYVGIHTDFGDRGWVNEEDDGTIVFGRRNIRNLETFFEASYVFMKDMSIKATARHYWATGQYIGYYVLREDGGLNDYVTYAGNHDFNFNSINMDIVYQWIFAPGSILSVAYKLNTMSEQAYVNFDYKNNVTTTIQGPQLNQVSMRVLYYLDYQYITNAIKRRKSN